MSNNQLLLQFLIAYLNWLYAGARGMPFNRSNGLCGNIYRYFGYCTKASSLKTHIRELFSEAGLDPTLPFNENGSREYEAESEANQCHRNIKRNLWVISQIERLQHEYPLPGHPQTNQPVQMLSLQPSHQTGK